MNIHDFDTPSSGYIELSTKPYLGESTGDWGTLTTIQLSPGALCVLSAEQAFYDHAIRHACWPRTALCNDAFAEAVGAEPGVAFELLGVEVIPTRRLCNNNPVLVTERER